MCSRCEGLSYERGIRYALWASQSTQRGVPWGHMIERGISMIFLPM